MDDVVTAPSMDDVATGVPVIVIVIVPDDGRRSDRHTSEAGRIAGITYAIPVRVPLIGIRDGSGSYRSLSEIPSPSASGASKRSPKTT